MAQKIVGLDIGNYSIKAIILESTYRGWELIGYHEMKIATDYVEAEAMIEKTSLPDEEKEEAEETEAGQEPAEGESETSEDSGSFDPEKERIRLAIQQFIRRHGADWDSLYTALDGDTISIKIFSLPFADLRQIEATVRFSLEELLPFSLADKVADYQILKRTQDESQLLAAVLDHDSMVSYLANFEAAGKEPKGVILDSLALGNVFIQLAEPELMSGTRVIVDFGHRKTSVCFIRDGQITFARTLSTGSQDLTKALAEVFDLDFEIAEKGKHQEGFVRSEALTAPHPDHEAIAATLEKALEPLVHHLRLTFQAYIARTRETIDSVHLCGGGSKLNGLPEFLAQSLGIPVSMFHYLRSEFDCLPESVDVEPNMAAGLGMALSGLRRSRLKALNFRKGDFAFKGNYEQWKGRIAHIGISLITIFTFFLFSIWSQFYVLGAEYDNMTDSIAKTCQEILGQNVTDAKKCVSQMMEVIKEQGTGGSKLKPEVSVLKLYDELVYRIMADDRMVEVKEMDISDKKIKVKGQVDEINTAGMIVESLKGYECFASISQGPTRASTTKDKIDFSLSITVDCGHKKHKSKDKEIKKDKDKAKEAP